MFGVYRKEIMNRAAVNLGVLSRNHVVSMPLSLTTRLPVVRSISNHSIIDKARFLAHSSNVNDTAVSSSVSEQGGFDSAWTIWMMALIEKCF
jgi:hypothetical protein